MIDRMTGLETSGGAARAAGPGNGRQKLLPDYTHADPNAPNPSDELRRLARKVERFIGEHPVLSVTAGLTFGILLGCLIKRR